MLGEMFFRNENNSKRTSFSPFIQKSRNLQIAFVKDIFLRNLRTVDSREASISNGRFWALKLHDFNILDYKLLI